MKETMLNECVTIGGTANKSENGHSNDIIEKWRDVPGYDGFYMVSSIGRVKRIAGAIWEDRKYKRDRILKYAWKTCRYPNVSLYDCDGKKKTFSVHQLVAAAFLGLNCCCPTCGNNLEINHKDGNRMNNQVENLEYVTRKQNMAHYLQSVQTT